MGESANVAFVRRIYALVNAGEFEELAAEFAEGFQWHPDELAPSQTARRTPDDAVEAVRDFTGAFADFHTEVEELTEDGDHVIVVARHVGRFGSGDVERREAHLWTFSDGRPRSLREFEDPEGAIEAIRETRLE